MSSKVRRLILKERRIELDDKLKNSVLKTSAHHKFIKGIYKSCRKSEMYFKRKHQESKKTRVMRFQKEMRIAEYVESDMDLFAKLPDEVVVMILDNLTNPEDLISCSNSSRRLRRILKPMRTTLLFGKILPLIINQNDVRLKDVKTWRLTCTTWKDGINEYARDLALRSHSILPCSYNAILKQDQLYSKIDSEVVDLLKWVDVSKVLYYHSYTGMEISLNFFCFNKPSPSTSHRTTHLDRNIQVVEHRGGNILNLKLTFSELRASSVFRLARICLSHVHGLRKLNLRGSSKIWCSSKRESKVARKLRKNLFPALPHLVDLELFWIHPLFYTHVLPLYCHQLNRLCIYLPADYAVPAITGDGLLLENLREFHVTQEKGEISWLLSLECPQLQDFQLCLLKKKEGESPTVLLKHETVVRVLQHFGTKLRRFSFTCSENAELMDGLSSPDYFNALGQLHLPYLRILELDGWFGSLDILLCLPGIQYLKFVRRSWYFDEYKYLHLEQCGDAVEFCGYLNRLYESNVWKLIPSLMEVQIEFRTVYRLLSQTSRYKSAKTRIKRFTRKGYEHFKMWW